MICITNINISELRGLIPLWMRLYPTYTLCSGRQDICANYNPRGYLVAWRVQLQRLFRGQLPRAKALTAVHTAARCLAPLKKRISKVKHEGVRLVITLTCKRVDPSLKYNSGSGLDSHHQPQLLMRAGGLQWFKTTNFNFYLAFGSRVRTLLSVNAESHGFLHSCRERLAKIILGLRWSNLSKKPHYYKKKQNNNHLNKKIYLL